MRKIFVLFALLLTFSICALAEETSPLGVHILTPIACDGAEGGEVIDLYCGPTQGFYRRDAQTLDLSRPYVFFGQFDCWAMVAQGTPEAFGPVGWVETALLDALPEAADLAFDDGLAAMVEEPASITNDPMSADEGAQWPITLERGAQVIILAQLGDWLYVQAEIEGMPARVFLPAASIL